MLCQTDKIQSGICKQLFIKVAANNNSGSATIKPPY